MANKRYAASDVADPTIILDHAKLVKKHEYRVPAKIKPRKTKRKPENDGIFRQAYLRGDSYKELCKRFAISNSTVMAWAVDLKLPRRNDMKGTQKLRMLVRVSTADREMVRAYCKRRHTTVAAVFHKFVEEYIGDEKLR